MKISVKTYSITSIIFSVITIVSVVFYFLDFISIEIVTLSLGVTQLLSGLSQIKIAQHMDSKGTSRGNKTVGKFYIILGIVIIISVITKLIL